MYIYKNEHNRQQADDWLWDTIPNNQPQSDQTQPDLPHPNSTVPGPNLT